jgi:polyhydroxyalkanoate synthase subunit PhaC
MLGALLHSADEFRRRQGQVLEALGYGPRTTPSRSVQSLPIARLLAYQTPKVGSPAILMVPAPIKKAYIWDLAPKCSVVARCLEAGLQVYLVCWKPPGHSDELLGLEHYSCQVISNFLDAISAETGQAKVLLAGHSLGGTFAAIFSSLHPERVRALIELEGPITFGSGSVEMVAPIGPVATKFAGMFGNVPGTALDLGSLYADAVAFNLEPLLDWFESRWSSDARRLHMQVRRWTLDESPMTGRLFEEVLEKLYCTNRFAEGRLGVGGRIARPKAIDMPILAVVDPRSRLVPTRSIEPYRSLTSSPDVRILPYPGDKGVVMQHVGVLVGPNAHDSLWPQILRWVEARA